MDTLPDEIILHCCKFLNPFEIVTLQHVSKRFLSIGRDAHYWREQCFESSSFLDLIRRRRLLLADDARLQALARGLATGNRAEKPRLASFRGEAGDMKEQSNERIRILANWDPSYPDEKVNWYDEYIARNAPIATNWLQQPRNRDRAEREYLEIRGMGLYREPGTGESTFVVAPLDDGSVCMWDIEGTRGRKGSILARSKPGILSKSPSGAANPKLINIGVTECVSVDNARQKAYIAVQSDLVEVDLPTLSLVSREHFPSTITALSEAKYPVPLTVGTSHSLYLHDPRTRRSSGLLSGDHERLETYSSSFGLAPSPKTPDFRSLLNPAPNPGYAHLSESGPLSILHLPSSGDDWDGNGEIYVAGRFSSILNYDRRYFPKLRGAIHSGARLCSMTSLPHPFASMEKDLARRGELSIEQIWEAKARPGKTLIACGEYNSKGSLEMYGLSSDPSLSTISSNLGAGSLQNSVMKNRQTSSSSKLLSVSNHGTRIVISDGSGYLKWLERDGITEARRWNIAHDSSEAHQSIFGTASDSLGSGSGDIVIKMVNTHSGGRDRPVNEDNLLLWTGEKIGLLNFSSKQEFSSDSFDEKWPQTVEEARLEHEEHIYSQTMRTALQMNANEVRFMRGMGLGGNWP